ncbi:MAG: cyclopropane-fatty-acyl-phospholipid synthase family protein [Rhizomicrobium sp.]|jgi:cyclopropane-fatty-acyl-phospholipid synthase
MLLAQMLNRFLKHDALILIDHRGIQYRCGNGDFQTAPIIRLKTRWLAIKLLLNPEVAAGEGYTSGELVFERGSLRSVMALFFRELELGYVTPLDRIIDFARFVARSLHQANMPVFARQRIAHHYDLNPALYRAMLGPTLEYSCAFFGEDAAPATAGVEWYLQSTPANLDSAQCRKERHIAGKLYLRPGMKVLDIGCGWGSMALHLAKEFDVEVTGITLSRQQLEICKQRAEEAGLQNRIKFELRDYRSVDDKFDRVVSVGMFEHVGTPFYRKFFKILADCLTPTGVALVHTIGRIDGPGATNAWIRKRIFPGGYIPALSEILTASERSGLLTADVEVLRLHYAFTLRSWFENFAAVRNQAVAEMGEQFVRMWEFYLAASEMSFVYGKFVNFQIQFCKHRSALPITRDYMSTRALGG